MSGDRPRRRKGVAALLEAIGYRHEPITGVYRRSPAAPEFLKKR